MLLPGHAANYIGGAAERVLYETGEKKLNDEAFVKAYADMGKVAPYLPRALRPVTYNDSQVLFATGKGRHVHGRFLDGRAPMATRNSNGARLPCPRPKA